ncbi:Lrp/AsnC family transcriptional regulator [Candidatus Woesearchaeota archaeon]|nr:Lrp/AsnC family transcriptional regulator [Candidatus Woesearchaeota archaeon]
MDKKDIKILTELLMNSRIPINRLAKKVGISREVANYRINKLIKNGTILGFHTTINTESLGYSRFGCFFQLKNISLKREREFLDYLKEHPFVNYLSPIIGKWNLAFDILAKNRDHLYAIIKEITSNIQGYIESYIITSTGAEQETFPTKILNINKEIQSQKMYKKQKLDQTDSEVLNLLSKNSRIEYKEISEKLKITPNTIRYRIKNLENSMIRNYTISIDIRKLGYEWQNIQLKVIGSKEDLLKQFLRQHKKVIYFYRYLGNENWDLDIGVIVKNPLELREFILELREKFGGIIKIYDIYIIIEELKGNYAPEGIFKIEEIT